MNHAILFHGHTSEISDQNVNQDVIQVVDHPESFTYKELPLEVSNVTTLSDQQRFEVYLKTAIMPSGDYEIGSLFGTETVPGSFFRTPDSSAGDHLGHESSDRHLSAPQRRHRSYDP